MTDRLCKKKGSDNSYRLLQIMPNSSFLIEDVKTGEIEIAVFGTVTLVPIGVSAPPAAAGTGAKSEEKK